MKKPDKRVKPHPSGLTGEQIRRVRESLRRHAAVRSFLAFEDLFSVAAECRVPVHRVEALKESDRLRL